MFQFFVSSGQVRGDRAYITDSDVNHIRNVLRLKAGDRIQIVQEDDENLYICSILKEDPTQIECRVEKRIASEAELPAQIYLFQGLPKSDKMELILQKAVELGVHEVIPVQTKNVVVKLDEKKVQSRITRWNLIAQAAAKQAKRGRIPEVRTVCTFAEAVSIMGEMDVRLIAYEKADRNGMEDTRARLSAVRPGQKVGIMIGPEGGFTEEEIAMASEADVFPITLGRRILRTETAGMTVLAWLVYLLEQ
ncbi:MAG: 16S rRNA (uracil(1498)-N(3))-methyltransferase [Lachnospiraceae bacterium]|nr:16S rRNA (uracil(1498)-N(3))-methyltransferase [Lachnospiraceae bacterium]